MLQLRPDYEFFTDLDPNTAILAAVVIGGLVAAFIIWGVLQARAEAQRKAGRFSRWSFRRRAARAGIPKAHARMLERLVQQFPVSNPLAIFEYPGILDGLLKKALQALQRSSLPPREKENQRHLLYQIKQLVDDRAQAGKTLQSSASLRTNTPVTVRFSTGEGFDTKVVVNKKEMLGLALPEGITPNSLPKKTSLSLTFLTPSSEAYVFNTRVVGLKITRDTPCFFVEHVKNIHQLRHRRFRRKDLDTLAHVYKVSIARVGSGKKAVNRAVVDAAHRFSATVQDLSPGGCALTGTAPLAPGNLLKVEFEVAPGIRVSAFGKVRHITQGYPGRTAHVMFTSITKQNLNRVRDFVYDFVDV